MPARLLVVFALMLCSGVAFGASSNPSVEERLATLETTMKLQFEALSKQNDATNERIDTLSKQNDATNERIDTLSKRIDTLSKQNDATNERIDATNERIDTLSKQIDTLSKQIDANNQSTLKLIETINDATNKRIDTLNNWWIVLFAGIVGWVVSSITKAIHNRERTETAKVNAHRPEMARKA